VQHWFSSVLKLTEGGKRRSRTFFQGERRSFSLGDLEGELIVWTVLSSLFLCHHFR